MNIGIGVQQANCVDQIEIETVDCRNGKQRKQNQCLEAKRSGTLFACGVLSLAPLQIILLKPLRSTP